MTVRITSPGTSSRATRGVRGSSAGAERFIVQIECAHNDRGCQALQGIATPDLKPALPNRVALTMLLKAMIGKRSDLHAAGSISLGLRALALLLP
jgi:hypothetical protein